jgi:hypothetical protein
MVSDISVVTEISDTSVSGEDGLSRIGLKPILDKEISFRCGRRKPKLKMMLKSTKPGKAKPQGLKPI